MNTIDWDKLTAKLRDISLCMQCGKNDGAYDCDECGDRLCNECAFTMTQEYPCCEDCYEEEED